MAINSVLQTIRNAEIDARSLSEFVSKGVSFTVTRRLAPTIHTLDYYLLVLNKVKEKGDLADIAISATLDKLSSLEPTVIQRVEDAINNTAVEGGVLADTFVVVDGSLSQRTINKGLESIADLTTINNPKDGLRVYVKSYHAGLGKGGGYFTYDSSKLSENNGGTVIDGWVRDEFNGCVYDFGAIGGGSLKALSGYFDSLDAANKFYPHAETMQDSIDWAAIQAIINLDKETKIPKGSFVINRPLVLKPSFSIHGEGRNVSKLISMVESNSLLKTKDTVAFGSISHIGLQGHSSVSCGHAINFCDPGTVGVGTHTPQHVTFDNIYIRGFKGFDRLSNGASIPSCGIIQDGGLGNIYSNVVISDCDIGFYMSQTQNTRIRDSVSEGHKHVGVVTVSNENLVIDGCDILNSGYESSSGLNIEGVSYGVDPSGNLFSHRNTGLVVSNSKFKNGRAGTDIKGVLNSGDVYSGNWFQGSPNNTNTVNCLYFLNSSNIKLVNNWFRISASVINSYLEAVTFVEARAGAEATHTISGNFFNFPNSMTVKYYIGLFGSGNVRPMPSTRISGNMFGYGNISGTCVVESCIFLNSVDVTNSSITENTVKSVKDVEVRSLIKSTSGSKCSTAATFLHNTYQGYNEFKTAAFKAYDSLFAREFVVSGSVSQGGSLNFAANETKQITINDTAFKKFSGDFIAVSTTSPRLGLTLSSSIDVDGELIVFIHNPTSTSITLSSGFITYSILRNSAS